MLLIISSCSKKENPIDPCSNGFVDAGETGVDCGGNCSPCIVYNPPSMYMELNGLPLSMSQKSISLSAGNYILTASNDSLTFKFNLGSSLSIGTFPMNTSGTLALKNGAYYLVSSEGTNSISSLDTVSKIVHGFLQVNISRSGFTDTLKIRNCQFDYIPYP
ncbi:MAG: hypothetical protein LW688_00715 [Cryomorphaceae bacterium]|nr:hypothetical protein [Cryomorphaceae bacterium]